MTETAADYNIVSEEHWTQKGDVRLFLWEKYVERPTDNKGAVLFVHGSSIPFLLAITREPPPIT